MCWPGGPPCQGFSLAGRRDRADPRNHLFRNLLELAELVKPKVLVMENVRLLLSMKDPDGGMVVDRILGEMAACGYDASVNTVNAQDYGVPQFRERVFIVATRRDSGIGPLRFPPKTHGVNGVAPLRTFRDATVDLAPRWNPGRPARRTRCTGPSNIPSTSCGGCVMYRKECRLTTTKIRPCDRRPDTTRRTSASGGTSRRPRSEPLSG